jgi:hypothetical protein
MSLTGIKLVCETRIDLDESNNPIYRTDYKTTAPVQTPSGPHVGGGIVTSIGDLTESTFNLQMQQAIADEANLQSSNVEMFEAADVYGGRI